MKCERAERLLPLLGRGDLKEKDARALQDHLVDCALCAESAHEHEAFFNLLHSTGGVDFDEEFFGRIRRSVLSEIQQRERPLPAPLRWWQSNPVTVLGTVVLMMIAFGAGIALLDRGLAGRNHESAAVPAEDVRQPPQAIPTTTIDVDKPDVKERRAAAVHPQRNAWNRSSRKSGNVKMAQVHDMIAKRDGKVPLDRRTQEERTNVALSVRRPATVQRQEASRIEILTADPNIRIIWLTAKSTN